MSEDTGNEEEAHRSPLRRTLDLCVFAPVGLAVTVVEDLPDLISKGRRRVELELGNARVVGRFVVNKGQRRVSGTLDELVRNGASRAPAEPAADHVPTAPAPRDAPAAPPPVRDTAAAAVVGGALADYDTLSASQVVPRLESLGTEQLQAVVRYEASHRNRRTILLRANQLLDEGAESTAANPAPAAGPEAAE